MKQNIAVVVLSCDNYSDLWSIFIKQFDENWPDCPYPKFISTNHKEIRSNSFKTIKIGDDISWSDGVIKVLDRLRLDYEFAFITLEDLPLYKKVDTKHFERMVTEFQKLNGHYLKFVRKPKPTGKVNAYFGEIGAGSLYRPTCVYALWRIDTLLELLDKGENAWEFERYGAVRSDKYSGFFVAYKDFIHALNTVVKGKWVKSDLKKIKKLGNVPENTRLIMSYKESVLLILNRVGFKIFVTLIPWKLRRTIVFSLNSFKCKKN